MSLPPKPNMCSSLLLPRIRSFSSVPTHSGSPEQVTVAASATPPATIRANAVVANNSRVRLMRAPPFSRGREGRRVFRPVVSVGFSLLLWVRAADHPNAVFFETFLTNFGEFLFHALR